jgi:hypothetical protein
MTFCTLPSEREFQAEIVTLLFIFLLTISKTTPKTHTPMCPQKGRKVSEINANKAHEKVYFKYCLSEKSFPFRSFAFFG